MVPKLWGMNMYAHEDTIYRILEYIQLKNSEWEKRNKDERPVQDPWSNWAVYEIIGELKLDESSYANEIIQRFIDLMGKYEQFAEPERKMIYRTARSTAQELYSYLFETKRETRKETIPF